MSPADPATPSGPVPPAPMPAPEHLPPTWRRPSMGLRLGLGIAGAVVMILVLVVLPTWAVGFAAAHGVTVGVTTTQIAIIGGLISIFLAARYVLKPTRAYGPAWIAAAGTATVSLLFLSTEPAITVNLPSYGVVTVSFGLLWGLLAIVPALRLVSAIITTVEDVRHPGERLPFDFPIKRRRSDESRGSVAPPAS